MNGTDITKEKKAILKTGHVWKSSIRASGRTLRTDSRAGDGFVFVLCGECEYVFDSGDRFTARADDVLYLGNGDAYSMQIDSGEYGYICANLLFEGEERRTSLLATPQSPRETEALFRKLLRLHDSPSSSRHFDSMSLLYAIYRDVSAAIHVDYVNRGAKDAVERAKAYIDLHFADAALDGAALAQLAGMSEVYFRTLFKSIFNTTPLQYILSLRIAYASELMQYTLLSLSECAAQSGFSSLSYFCRVFKKKCGISPAAYRKELQK